MGGWGIGQLSPALWVMATNTAMQQLNHGCKCCHRPDNPTHAQRRPGGAAQTRHTFWGPRE
eukprot:11195080-Lingulodinium_polyedra.AAC.1